MGFIFTGYLREELEGSEFRDIYHHLTYSATGLSSLSFLEKWCPYRKRNMENIKELVFGEMGKHAPTLEGKCFPDIITVTHHPGEDWVYTATVSVREDIPLLLGNVAKDGDQ